MTPVLPSIWCTLPPIAAAGLVAFALFGAVSLFFNLADLWIAALRRVLRAAE